MRYSKLSYILLSTVFFFNSCTKDAGLTEQEQQQIEEEEQQPIDTTEEEEEQQQPEEEQPVDTSARGTAKTLYEEYYLASKTQTADVAWSGDESSCNAGDVPQGMADKILRRIAYFRIAAGLNNTIAENDTKSGKAQQAALMMMANGTLDHFPPESWKCYSTEGKDGAGNSLLTQYENAEAIDSYIRDFGDNNGPVGHRRWLLWPRLQEIGIGNTSQTNAIWVLNGGGAAPADAPEFIAWPPEGYSPSRLAYERWSFSIRSADFSSVQVTVTSKDGNSVALELEELVDNTYGDNTLVWKPAINRNTITADTPFTVNIQNVNINDQMKDFEYEVILFDVNN